jgi:hypothetical protein
MSVKSKGDGDLVSLRVKTKCLTYRSLSNTFHSDFRDTNTSDSQSSLHFLQEEAGPSVYAHMALQVRGPILPCAPRPTSWSGVKGCKQIKRELLTEFPRSILTARAWSQVPEL